MTLLNIDDFDNIPEYIEKEEDSESDVGKSSQDGSGIKTLYATNNLLTKIRGYWGFYEKTFSIQLNRVDLKIDLKIHLHKIETVKDLIMFLKKIQIQPNELQFENLLLLLNDICKNYLNTTLYDLLKRNTKDKIVWGVGIEQDQLKQEHDKLVSVIKKIKERV